MGLFAPKEKEYLKFYKKQASSVINSSKLLVKMMAASANEFQGISKEMRSIDAEADNIKQEARVWINSTFITPFDRDDMLILSSRMDDVIDQYDKLIDVIYLFEIEELPKKVSKQISILEDLAISLYAVISGLGDIKTHLDELKQIDKLVLSCEKIHRDLLAKLFKDDKDFVKIMKTRELLEALSQLLTAFRQVSSVIGSIEIKES
jgi:uncharacterized protein Yka (UPF0111/DUF47 family)